MKIKIVTIKNLQDEEDFISILNNISPLDNEKFCIDFEFNGKEIGLMQLYITKINIIFLLNPELLKPENKSILINKVFLSQHIKILHGSESNDIPYIFNKLLNKDPNKILLFINNFYDTRFICSLLSFPRCNLYQALINCEIIKQDKLDFLKDIEKKLGKIWKIKWNPFTLNSNEKLYALYDVIFLSRLFRKQKKLCKQQKLKINRLHYALRIVLLYRQNFLHYYEIKKIENIEEYFDNILEIDYLRKLKTIFI
jgi:hypothetical protein